MFFEEGNAFDVFVRPQWSAHFLFGVLWVFCYISAGDANTELRFYCLCFRKKYVCGTSWLSNWGTNLMMSLAMWTSSLLQTPGGTFSESNRPSVIWSAASFRFRLKLSLLAGSRQTVSNSGLVLQTDMRGQLWEPASTLCLPSQPSCPYPIISVFLCLSGYFFFFQQSVWCKLSETLI